MSTTTAAEGVTWRRVSPAALRGEGLEPYPASDTSSLFDWSERTDASSTHVMAYAGQFLIDVVEIEDNAVHQPSKPGDEIVCVLNGVLKLTTDGVDGEQVYRTGEFVLIPAGWAGVYRVISENGLFRELCIVPADYFDAAPAPSGLAPRAIEPLRGPGEEVVLDARYTITVRRDDEGREADVALAADEIVRVLAGELTLHAGGEAETFAPGSFVVLPKGFRGRVATSAGYQALVARWNG